MDRPDEERAAEGTRRDFLTGKSLLDQGRRAAESLSDQIGRSLDDEPYASTGDMLRLETRAMACTFAVQLPMSARSEVPPASAALDEIHELESQLTVYRPESEMSRLNAQAGAEAVTVERGLYQFLRQAAELSRVTAGCFDPTSGALISLWRRVRTENRVPTTEEVAEALSQCGPSNIEWNDAAGAIRHTVPRLSWNLGAIGKGYAIDRAAQLLKEQGVACWLFHGGQSSILAGKGPEGLPGWPIALQNPLFPAKTLMTVFVREQSLATSGSGTQYFRHGGKRYGHILDPRSGWPVDGLLSVSVLAATAAEADALSTAFFVGGVEIARRYCDNNPETGAILISHPVRGQQLDPIILNIPADQILLASPA